MKAEYQITLTLSDEEAATLARLLGNLAESEFSECGIEGAEREIMREIWKTLAAFNNEHETEE